MIAVADKHPNVFIDTSAHTTRRYPLELVDYMNRRDGKKVLFGTNYPMIAPEQALRDLDALELEDSTRQLFLSGNARKVFKV